MSKKKTKQQDTAGQLAELFGNPEMLVMDGFDDCIIGVIERFGIEPIICYSKGMVIAKLCEEGDMSEDEAEEYWSYNMIGAWLGDGTPCFFTATDEAIL